MWSRVVTVVIVSCLVSSVTSLTDLEDNAVPDDNLQDLNVRTKKSPVDISEKTASESESKSDSELKAVLTEDIKRKITDLKELKNAYRKVETDFFGSEGLTLKSFNEKSDSQILGSEIKTPIQASTSESDSKPVRVARQYYPTPTLYGQLQKQNHDSQTESDYSNPKYQSTHSNTKETYTDRDAPYIAKYNPSSRTFGLSGIEGALKIQSDLQELFKVHDKKPEVTILTPATSVQPVEVAHPTIPDHIAPSVNLVLPASLPTVTLSEHKPLEGAVHTKHETKVPVYYEKKEIGTPESFFSKQVMYGPSTAFDEHSYNPYTAYSSYSQGYPYGVSPYSYWYAADRNGYSSPGYSSYSEPQTNVNYGPAYSPGYSYHQGHKPAGYYPAVGAYRSHSDLSDQFQQYQDELDSLLTQFFRYDSAGREQTVSPDVKSNNQKEKEAIEIEEKRIVTEIEEIKKTAKDSKMKDPASTAVL